MIISSKIQPSKRHLLKEDNVVFTNKELHYKVHAFEWSEIIRAARARLQYCEHLSQLAHDQDKGLQKILKPFHELSNLIASEVVQ